MRRGLFLIATLTVSSALYAQGLLTRTTARELFGAYNPMLLQEAQQDENLNQLVEEVLNQYLVDEPADTLENRYMLIALARNFENSIALNQTLEEYKQALLYSQQGIDVQNSARAHAQDSLNSIYSRIWAVSVQVKEGLLSRYQQAYRTVTNLEEKQDLLAAINAVKTDLKSLHTNTGEQLVSLTHATLAQAEAQAAASQLQRATLVEEAKNLNIKTKHKKPVAG
ncbi:MAG: hypothetical protein J6Y17_02310 [Elusimicrobiaceae bacterium]|nr:hypothetical protein [Elusimicrobiaceae bacterium]